MTAKATIAVWLRRAAFASGSPLGFLTGRPWLGVVTAVAGALWWTGSRVMAVAADPEKVTSWLEQARQVPPEVTKLIDVLREEVPKWFRFRR